MSLTQLLSRKELEEVIEKQQARIEELEAAIRKHKDIACGVSYFDEDGVFYGPSTADSDLWAVLNKGSA